MAPATDLVYRRSAGVFTDRNRPMSSASLGVYTCIACVVALTVALFVSTNS